MAFVLIGESRPSAAHGCTHQGPQGRKGADLTLIVAQVGVV